MVDRIPYNENWRNSPLKVMAISKNCFAGDLRNFTRNLSTFF